MAKRNLDYIFQPKSVAIAGVSSKETSLPRAGQRYLEAMLSYGFKGKIYPLNPKGGEIKGLRIYTNIKDIPEPVDYVISCVPARAVLQLIKDCAAKGVKVVQCYTAGFSETGLEEGKQLEREICSLSHRGGIRIIGPNCLGVYCPRANFSYHDNFPKESGSTALICQSGGNTTYLVCEGGKRGIRFSKAISYGNAAAIDECDLLEHLAADPDTEIILAYIEGVKDGRRFNHVLKEAAQKRPVIILKGGTSESGARAAASHTGALAGSDKVWDGLLRQAGAVRVYSFEELIDMAVTFSHSFLPRGRRAGILGISGGATVLATDDCAGAGLVIPHFPKGLRKKLSDLLESETGAILNNPVDLAGTIRKLRVYDILNVLSSYEKIDLIMVHFPLGISLLPACMRSEFWDSVLENVIRAHRKSTKPIMVVIYDLISKGDYEWMLEAQRKCYEAGIPVYHSIGNAAKALDRFLRYYEHKAREGQD